MYSKLMTLAAATDPNQVSLVSWDWIIIALFFAAMIWICWDVSKKKKETSGEYFLSGRDATWIAIGASIFASNIGSEHLIGLAGSGASSGLAMAHWEIQMCHQPKGSRRPLRHFCRARVSDGMVIPTPTTSCPGVFQSSTKQSISMEKYLKYSCT